MNSLFTLLIFIFPGIIFLFQPKFLVKNYFVEKIFLVPVISLSYWITSFWILKYLPIPLNIYIYFSLILSALGLTYAFIKNRKKINLNFSIKDILILAGFLVIAIPYIQLFRGQIVPTGSDMSMHTYLASIIVENNKFPADMKPLLPVSEFGLNPIGFPTLVAEMTLINRLPTYRNALLLIAISHFMFCLAIYIFLRLKFSPGISWISTILVAWLAQYPQIQISTGASPSVLSIAFIFFFLFFVLNRTKTSITLAVLCFCTAFFIQPIPVVALGYILAVEYLILYKYLNRTFGGWLNMAKAVALCLLILTPFLIYYFFMHWQLQPEIRDWVFELQTTDSLSWIGNISNFFITISKFFNLIFGAPLLVISLFGLVMVFLKSKKQFYVIAIYLTVLVLLIINTHYWWLPFSAIMYAGRVAFILTIPIAYLTAYLISETFNYLNIILAKISKNPIFARTATCLVMGSVLVIFSNILINNYQKFLNSKNNNNVNLSDLIAFDWLKKHTTTDDIIRNIYGDAGLWIPAIAYRQVTIYHTNPVDMYEIKHAIRKQPAYAFFGSRNIDPESLLPQEDFGSDPIHYREIFRLNNTRIFEVIKQL